MKLPPFNHAVMEWDGWRAFHIDHGYSKFTQFDTGEFVVCSRRWAPDNRQVYKDLHIQVVATDDEDCPKLYLPGMASVVGAKPVFKSHLNHNGQQILLLDFNHKRAVSLDRWLTKDNAPSSLPERFLDRGARNISAYYAGPKATPIAAPITRHFPAPLTTEQRTHIKELEAAAKVWLEMQPDPEGLKKKHRDVRAVPVLDCVDVSFGVLTTEHRTAVALRGFNMIIKETHPWLTFNVEGEWTNEETADDE